MPTAVEKTDPPMSADTKLHGALANVTLANSVAIVSLGNVVAGISLEGDDRIKVEEEYDKAIGNLKDALAELSALGNS